jgi:hypothetical protein
VPPATVPYACPTRDVDSWISTFDQLSAEPLIRCQLYKNWSQNLRRLHSRQQTALRAGPAAVAAASANERRRPLYDMCGTEHTWYKIHWTIRVHVLTCFYCCRAGLQNSPRSIGVYATVASPLTLDCMSRDFLRFDNSVYVVVRVVSFCVGSPILPYGLTLRALPLPHRSATWFQPLVILWCCHIVHSSFVPQVGFFGSGARANDVFFSMVPAFRYRVYHRSFSCCSSQLHSTTPSQ